ncbi:MAG: sigma-70 family RNA polymerase sigma factor [Bacteroidia bacterium]|nr:sigma-70 family RNA polymerase sigma factor [Bacteroidia bacterium]
MYTDQEILNGCKKQEPFFQEMLYKRYASKMLGVCLRYAPDREVANDIFQEGFIKVFQNLDTFKGESALGSWMYRIFMTTSINYIQRTLKHKFEVSINENLNPIEEEISENEREHWLNHVSQEEALQMVQDLPEKYRLIINMYAIDQLSHSEISLILGINETSSRSQLSRARKLLGDQLKIKLEKKFGK